MMSANQLILTGDAIENATSIITFSPRTWHADGIDIALSVKLLEYAFEVQTFFYGYNLEIFLKEIEEVSSGPANRFHLFNYDQTLVLEFIKTAGVIFLSLDYKSVLPQRAEGGVLKELRTASRLDSTRRVGSGFFMSFLPLHNNLSEIGAWLTGVLNEHPLSTKNPYPH